MKIVLILTSLTLFSLVEANEKLLGEYSTISESQCNNELILLSKNKGKFIFTCRREDGSHIDDVETENITWKIKGNKIITNISGTREVFTYYKNLSCESFGAEGSNIGLVGYSETEFWKRPIKCK